MLNISVRQQKLSSLCFLAPEISGHQYFWWISTHFPIKCSLMVRLAVPCIHERAQPKVTRKSLEFHVTSQKSKSNFESELRSGFWARNGELKGSGV